MRQKDSCIRVSFTWHAKGAYHKMALTKEDLQEISDLMDVKLQPVHHRLGKLESKVSDIKVVQTEIRSDIIKLERKISDTYRLALDAWGKSTENRNWFGKSKFQT